MSKEETKDDMPTFGDLVSGKKIRGIDMNTGKREILTSSKEEIKWKKDIEDAKKINLEEDFGIKHDEKSDIDDFLLIDPTIIPASDNIKINKVVDEVVLPKVDETKMAKLEEIVPDKVTASMLNKLQYKYVLAKNIMMLVKLRSPDFRRHIPESMQHILKGLLSSDLKTTTVHNLLRKIKGLETQLNKEMNRRIIAEGELRKIQDALKNVKAL